jgi:hypothetical protein
MGGGIHEIGVVSVAVVCIDLLIKVSRRIIRIILGIVGVVLRIVDGGIGVIIISGIVDGGIGEVTGVVRVVSRHIGVIPHFGIVRILFGVVRVARAIRGAIRGRITLRGVSQAIILLVLVDRIIIIVVSTWGISHLLILIRIISTSRRRGVAIVHK